MTQRIENTFSQAKAANRAALITYIMAYDPDAETSLALMKGLPEAGADIIELGIPFSDPMADGPTIQAAANRALEAGCTVRKVIEMVQTFREDNQNTPIVLMGYYNPIYRYRHHSSPPACGGRQEGGVNDEEQDTPTPALPRRQGREHLNGIEDFVKDAVDAGVDGVIIVDLPPEEEQEFTDVSIPAGLSLIKLTTPTTDKARAKVVLERASGFVYYISIAGITGTESPEVSDVKAAVDQLLESTDLPIAVGFGIKTPEQAAELAPIADGIVIGSVLVELSGKSEDVLARVKDIVKAVKA